jgi:hypothetical protein
METQEAWNMKRLACLVVCALAVGCGGSSNSTADICTNAVNAVNGVNTKAAACVPPGTAAVPTVSAQQCTTSLASCTDNDKTIINNFVSCLNALPTCTVATQTTWAAQGQACLNQVGGLSAACSGALQ